MAQQNTIDALAAQNLFLQSELQQLGHFASARPSGGVACDANDLATQFASAASAESLAELKLEVHDHKTSIDVMTAQLKAQDVALCAMRGSVSKIADKITEQTFTLTRQYMKEELGSFSKELLTFIEETTKVRETVIMDSLCNNTASLLTKYDDGLQQKFVDETLVDDKMRDLEKKLVGLLPCLPTTAQPVPSSEEPTHFDNEKPLAAQECEDHDADAEPRFFEGQFVRLHGLGAKDKNNMPGTVVHTISDSGRIGVLLAGSPSPIAVKPRNIIEYKPATDETCRACKGALNLFAFPPCCCTANIPTGLLERASSSS